MVALLEYWLAVFGLTNAITFLHIGKPIREFFSGVSDDDFYERARCVSGKGLQTWRHAFIGRLFRCHACMGFWVGIPLALFFQKADIFVIEYDVIASAICASLSASAVNFIIWALIHRFTGDL